EELAVSRRVTGRRVTGNRLGEIQAAPVGPAAQRPFDAAMLVAKRDFEMDHPLAMAVEAEMPGLNDTGMHRADRHLVDLRTGDREELRVTNDWPARREPHGVQPGMPFRMNAVLLRNLPLEMMRRRAVRGQRRISIRDHCGAD